MSIIICLEKRRHDSEVIQGQPLGAGQYPKSALWHQRTIFFIWDACLPAAGEITSLLPDTPLLHTSPAFSRPQLDLELAIDGRKRSKCCAWAMERTPFIGQSGQALGNKLWWPFFFEFWRKSCWIAMRPFLRSWFNIAFSIIPKKAPWFIKIRYNTWSNDFQRPVL